MQIGYSKKISETILEEFFDIILKNLIKTKKVKISKFGTFSLKRKKSRVGLNPKTKEKALISERNVVTFKASNEFKKYVNNQSS